jgi:predicted hotdog family 3-hydroxylacyl-ACP dehydratase
MSGPDLPVEDYLAQRGRMKLLDAVLQVDAQQAVTSSVVTKQWPLLNEPGTVSPIVIVELVAQTAGVSIRWQEMQELEGREKDGGGLIVGIKEAVFHVPGIQVDSRIITWAEKRHSFASYSEYQGHCKSGQLKLGEATIQVLRTR